MNGKGLAQVPRRCALVAAVAASLALPLGVASAAGANVTVTSHFVVTATPATITGDSLVLNNGATNDRPGDLVFATPNWDANGVCGCAYDTTPVGVWYNAYAQRWAVFNESKAAMLTGESFNILVVPAATSSAFVQTSTTANTLGDFTLINSPLTNGKPTVKLQVTQNFDPNGVVGALNNRNIGVTYRAATGEWAIFNEDRTPMATGLSFNVLVGSGASNGGKVVGLKTSAANRTGDGTFIKNAETTGNPNTVVFVTQNWNPKDVGGTYNDSSVGVYHEGTYELAFDESGVLMPLKAAFNLLVFGS